MLLCPWLTVRNRTHETRRNEAETFVLGRHTTRNHAAENKKSTKSPCAYIARDRA